jgi:hypothetical protein
VRVPQPFHLNRTEHPRLAVTPWKQRSPPSVSRSRSSERATRDLPPTFAEHLFVPSSSAISKSLRSTAMAATNGVNDQVLRWQRELRGYRLRFPVARKPGARRAREKALGCASAQECTPSGCGSNDARGEVALYLRAFGVEPNRFSDEIVTAFVFGPNRPLAARTSVPLWPNSTTASRKHSSVCVRITGEVSPPGRVSRIHHEIQRSGHIPSGLPGRSRRS